MVLPPSQPKHHPLTHSHTRTHAHTYSTTQARTNNAWPSKHERRLQQAHAHSPQPAAQAHDPAQTDTNRGAHTCAQTQRLLGHLHTHLHGLYETDLSAEGGIRIRIRAQHMTQEPGHGEYKKRGTATAGKHTALAEAGHAGTSQESPFYTIGEGMWLQIQSPWRAQDRSGLATCGR